MIYIMTSASLNIFFFFLSMIVLLLSGALVVRNLTRIMHFFSLTEYFVSFVLMSISTTIPELFVGISAALAGDPALSLGNVVGSIIVDMSLVAGILTILARKIKIQSKEIRVDSILMIFILFIPMGLYLIGNKISRLDGLILIMVFIAYFVHVLIQKEKEKKLLSKIKISFTSFLFNAFLFVVGIFILYQSSKYAVKYSIQMAEVLQLHPIFIGLFFVALGTSLPELVFGMHAILTNHPRFILGDLIGASIVNSTLVLGITALISPIVVNMYFYLIPAFTMLVICFIFMSFLQSGKMISLIEGVSLVLLYVLFLLVELALKGILPVMG